MRFPPKIEYEVSACRKKEWFGHAMYRFMRELYPICRSITGEGVRETLKKIGKHISIKTREIPTGKKVFDWFVPKEWDIKDAYIIDPKGKKIVDFKKSNLHVVSYSIPVRTKMSLRDLKPHLHTLPDHPDVIPYLTSYYNESWGFCLSHNQLRQLKDGQYEVCIDSNLKKGSLTLAESFLKGQSDDEVVISSYICHPSLCNDNLSGPVLATFLAKYLSQFSLRYSYRFLFIPETIGSIAWLSLNEKNVSKIKHGLVATCLGGPGPYTYQRTRQGNAGIDRVVSYVLKHFASDSRIVDFTPVQSDDRQFSSPGFNLPFGLLLKSPFFEYRQYHTSADNLKYVRPQHLQQSFSIYQEIISILENNRTYVNLFPKCEPQLGRRGLYRDIGSQRGGYEKQIAMLWVLNFSDGRHDLLDIAERANIDFDMIKQVADLLLEKGLLKGLA